MLIIYTNMLVILSSIIVECMVLSGILWLICWLVRLIWNIFVGK